MSAFRALSIRPAGASPALLRKAAAALALCAALGACTPQFRNHGYAPEETDLAEIVVGVDTRATVEDVIGPPSAAGVRAQEGYFYVAQRVRRFGFLEPEVISREIVAIRFGPDDVVTNIERFGLEDGQVVPLSRRVTDSSVTNTTFLRQLFGNLGRFDAGAILDEGPS